MRVFVQGAFGERVFRYREMGSGCALGCKTQLLVKVPRVGCNAVFPLMRGICKVIVSCPLMLSYM